MAAVVPMLIKLLVSLVFSLIKMALSMMMKKPKKVDSSSQAQKQNVSETTAYIPRCYGINKVGIAVNFIDSKVVMSGTREIDDDAEIEIEDMRLYQLSTVCEGEIDAIMGVYIDKMSETDPKFGTRYRLGIQFDWEFEEPDPVQIYSPYYVTTQNAIFGSGFGNIVNIEGQTYRVTAPYRYYLYRKDSAGKIIEIARLKGGVQTHGITQRDYAGGSSFFAKMFLGSGMLNSKNVAPGDFEYILIYKRDTGEEIEVGTASVHLDYNQDAFVQFIDNNLTITQSVTASGGFLTSQKYEGTNDQEPPAFFVNEISLPAKAYPERLCMLAYSILKHTKEEPEVIDAQPIKSSRPEFEVLLRGSKIYDPRDITQVEPSETDLSTQYINQAGYKYCNNSAIVLLDYLLGWHVGRSREAVPTYNKIIFGANVPLKFIDMQSFIDASNYCDELVPTASGGTMTRYTCDGRVDTSLPVVENINLILESMNARLIWEMGKFRVLIMKPEVPVKDITIRDLANDDITITSQSLKDRINSLRIKFIDPELEWEDNIITITDSSYLEQDKGTLYETELELEMVKDYDRANQLGMLHLKQARLGNSITFNLLFKRYDLSTGDVITFTHEILGYDKAKFRINSVYANNEGVLEITATEYSDLAYQIDTYEVRPPLLDSNYNPFIMYPPSNITYSQKSGFTQDGRYTDRLILSWSPTLSTAVQLYKIEYQLAGGGNWRLLGSVADTTLVKEDMQTGLYNIRIKALNSIGIESEYAYKLIEVVSSTVPPPDVQNFSIKAGETTLTLQWDAVIEVAFSGGYLIRHVANTIDAEWTDPPTFEFFVRGSQTSVTVGQIDGTYMIKAISATKLYSENEARIVYDMPADKELVMVDSIQADPAFTGTFDHMLKMDDSPDYITTIGVRLWDDIEGDWDDYDMLWDDMDGNSLVGSYTSDQYIDLGATFRGVLDKEINTFIYQLTGNWDDTSGNWDDREGLWDGDEPVGARAIFLFSTTNDDPAGTPAWSEWTELTRNDITARGVRFRCEIITQSTDQKVSIIGMKCRVFLRKRTEIKNINVNATPTAVAFDAGFYDIPTVITNIQNAQSGDYTAVSGITRSGFTISCYDSTNTQVSRVVGYIAQGLGEEV